MVLTKVISKMIMILLTIFRMESYLYLDNILISVPLKRDELNN